MDVTKDKIEEGIVGRAVGMARGRMPFDESKIKRDQGGRFATKPGGGAAKSAST